LTSAFPRSLEGLLRPQAYAHPVDRVELVQTHISWILLAGAFAYKILRPVAYAFLDMRSFERRRFLCEEELRLNRRFAAELYLEVCEIRLDAGVARIGGAGQVIETAVRMQRFDRSQELDRLLAAGQVGVCELEDFGIRIAAIHAQLPSAPADSSFGTPAQVRALVLENFAQATQACAQRPLEHEALERLREPLGAMLEALQPWLQRRRACGCVRECHGDLHSRNIVRHGGRLLAFDCLEFEPAFRWIDRADEAALLLVDLEARGFAAHAYAFWSGYLRQSGDYQSHRVLNLYKVHRALVRAKVAALSLANEAAPAERAAWLQEGQQLIAQAARRLPGTCRPLMVLMCGLSGSGKSWLAAQLVRDRQLIELRSDLERQRMSSLGQQRGELNAGRYAQRSRTAVYERLYQCAEDVLAGGYDVLIDATFQQRSERARFRSLAQQLGAELRVVHCHADVQLMRQRLAQRRALAADPSEANEQVLEWQLQHFEALQPQEGLNVIEADTADPLLRARVLAQLPPEQGGAG